MPTDFGAIFLFAGTLSLVVARYVDFQQADKHPLWQWFTRPYAFLDAKWIAGGRRRYFYLMGGLFVVIGILGLVPRPAEQPVAPSASADEDTVGCMFQPKSLHPDPRQLLEEYLRRDAEGEFLSSSQWDLGARTCPGHQPGFDASTVITSYRVQDLRTTADTVWYSVVYQVLGPISDDSMGGLTVAPATQTDTFSLVRTAFGWRISSALDLNPHILPRIAAQLQTRTRDRRILDSVAQETHAVWGVAVMPFEASPSQLQPQADSARAHVVSVLRGAGIRLVNRPPSKADAGPLVPARFAVVGTVTATGDSIRLDARLINVETSMTMRQVNLTGPVRGGAALGEMVGRIVSPDIKAAAP